MVPTISLGPVVLPTSGLVYIIGAWVVLSVVERVAKQMRLDAESIYGLAALILAAGFIGARFVFVILHWSAFQENLTGIIWPLTSGYNFWGGLFLGVVAGILFGRYKQLPLASTLDALTPGLLTSLLVVSLADFLGGPGYGTETNMPWGIDLFGILRHPVQIYEIVVAILGLLAWWWVDRHRQFAGQPFLVGIMVYAAGRFFLDAYRANTPLSTNGYHIVQIVTLGILLICLYLLGRMYSQELNQEPAEHA